MATKRGWSQTLIPMALDVAAEVVKRARREDKQELKVFGPSPGVQTRNHTSIVRSPAGSSVVSTNTGVHESVIWGRNPFPNLSRFSAKRAAAESSAVEDGVPYHAPITITDWEYGHIWSAIKTGDPAVWTSDFQQGKCGWYAFPTISAADIDKAYAACWNNDATVDATHLTSIESYVNLLEFRNTGSSPIEVDVFQCWAREDIPIADPVAGLVKDQFDLLYQGSQANLLNGPDLFTNIDFSAWQPQVSGSVYISPTAWDFTPFDHPIWRQLFKCRPYYHRLMAPGDSTRAHFGTSSPMLCDPADDLLGDGANNPTQAIWGMKKAWGPIYLMRVRGTIVEAQNSSNDVKLGNNTTIAAGEGHPERPKINYGNFILGFTWKSDMYARAVSTGNLALPQQGYYGGLYPRLTTQIWDLAHEFSRVTNNPSDVTNNP